MNPAPRINAFRREIVLLAMYAIAGLSTAATYASEWPESFRDVAIESSTDDHTQRAHFRSTTSDVPRPLLVSLHSWSGDYHQTDDLAPYVLAEDWNYIHPDFRGPNTTPDACLSPKALADIDDAIAFALDQGHIDRDNVFVVGSSGGGYATVGTFLKTRHAVRAFLAWVPITDLVAWFRESNERGRKYAADILQCVGDGDTLNKDEALRRSPLHWHLDDRPRGRLELFAGIDDGHSGSVPISHSLLFYNRLVDTFFAGETRINETEFDALMDRTARPTGDTIGDRAIFLHRNTPLASITVFDGGHEMLARECFERLLMLADEVDSSPSAIDRESR
jgi:pimeloyl-ACP methyl ester carboxylesterase